MTTCHSLLCKDLQHPHLALGSLERLLYPHDGIESAQWDQKREKLVACCGRSEDCRLGVKADMDVEVRTNVVRSRPDLLAYRLFSSLAKNTRATTKHLGVF